MTNQTHLAKFLRWQGIARLARATLTPKELEVYDSLLKCFEQLLSYAPRRVRELLIDTLDARAKMSVHTNGTPQELRQQLLALIVSHGRQDVLLSYAQMFLFSDRSINDWCHKHDLVFMTYSREENGDTLEFITFDKIHHDYQ